MNHFSHTQELTVALAFIGYRFNDYFSAEVGYDSIEEKNDTLFDMSTIEMQGGDAAIVVNKLFDKHFNVYAKAGAALINAKEKSNEFPDMNSNVTSLTPEIGGGVDYYFTKHFALGVTGNYYVEANNMPSMWSAGIRTSYTF